MIILPLHREHRHSLRVLVSQDSPLISTEKHHGSDISGSQTLHYDAEPLR